MLDAPRHYCDMGIRNKEQEGSGCLEMEKYKVSEFRIPEHQQCRRACRGVDALERNRVSAPSLIGSLRSLL